jgi:pyridoxal 5'-phosphate synthase pdxS subunit
LFRATIRPSREHCLDSFRQIAARQENAMPAALALDADVGPQPENHPHRLAARMRFPQLEYVSNCQIGEHRLIIPAGFRKDPDACMVEYARTMERRNAMENNRETGSFAVKKGLAQMLKGGVIMDVVTPEHAKIAEEAGACAVMALERVPADIRAQGGVARMSDPELILRIMDSVTIPVMAKCRIGHFVEAQVLEAIGIDYIDESEVLTPADEEHHIYKHDFKVPFVCGCRNLGEALRRVGEGAAMIRTKGEAGTGDVVEAVRHARTVLGEIRRLQNLPDEELMAFAKTIGAPFELVKETRELGRMPVVNFAAGGVATPADAALMMQLGVDGVFVGSGIFKSGDPAKRANAIVKAVTHFKDAKIIAEVSKNLGEPMVGRQIASMPKEELIAGRGW